MSEKIEVVVIGSAMIDLTAYAEKMPAVGETLLGKSFEKNFGGKGANQAVQCQRLGISTAFIGRVGADSYGSEYIANFQKEGIATTFFRQVEGATSGIASIWVDENGNNSIIIVPGANLHQNPDQLKSNLSSFPLTKVVVFQNEISEDATFTGLKLARELNILSIFNPAPVSKGCAQMVPFTDILCVNEVELAILSEKTVIFEESSIREASQALLELGCKEVVVTFGSKGAYLVNQSTFRHFPAPLVKAVDTVGAGDSFIGCMAANLARGVDLVASIERAVEVASISVQSKGAQPSYANLSTLPPSLHPPVN